MTLSTSTGTNPTVGELIADAWRTASVVEVSQQPSEAQMGYGRRKLQRILDWLPTQGVFARTVRLYDLTLIEGENVYQLPSWVMDVTETAAYIKEDEDIDAPSTTSPVTQISREQWIKLGDYSTTGDPVSFWIQEDLEPLRLHLYPRPPDDGVLRLAVRRHLAAIENDAVTIDLQRYWMRYLEYALAAEFALQTDQKREFFSLAQQQLAEAKAEANENVVGQYYLDHPV